MIWKATLVLSLALCVLSDRPAVSEQKLERFYSGHHGDLSHIGRHEPEHHEVYAWAYPSYEFSYYVDDPHTHDQKGQHEVRDGDKVNGNYWLVQPDGRKRIVKYSSDHKSGFHAEVNYVPHDGHHHIEHHEKRGHTEDHKADGRHDGDRRSHNEDRHKWGGHDIVDRRSKHQDHEDNRHWDGRRDGGHDEWRGGDDRGDRKEGRGRGEGGRKQGGGRREDKNRHEEGGRLEERHRHEEESRRDGEKGNNRGHNDNRDHLWGIHGWGKGRDDHKGNRHDGDEGWRYGHGREERWRHGVLVGWQEGKGREDHREGDDRRGHDSDHGREDRRDQHSHHNPIMNLKPVVPYGYRLH